MRTSVVKPVSARLFDIFIYQDGVCVEKKLRVKGRIQALKQAHYMVQYVPA